MFNFDWVFKEEGRNFAAVISMFIAAGSAVVAAITLIFAGRNLRRSVVDKNTDVSLKIEESYRAEILTMLACEYMPSYNRVFLSALVKSVRACQRKHLGDVVDAPVTADLSQAERDAIDRLEAMLRHFFFAQLTYEANASLRSLLRQHGYYLALFTRDTDERADLRDYIQQYWPHVFKWGLELQQDHPNSLAIAPPGDSLCILHEAISERAYEIYQERCRTGVAAAVDDDWQAAHQQLQQETAALRKSTEKHRSAFRNMLSEKAQGVLRIKAMAKPST